MQHAIPSPDDTEDLLLSCRYGDLDDAKSFIDRFGTAPLGEARDENGNTILHMASANGHTGEWTPTPLFPLPSRGPYADPRKTAATRAPRLSPPTLPFLPPLRPKLRRLDGAPLGRTQRPHRRRTRARRVSRRTWSQPDRRQERRGTFTARRGGGGWVGRGCQVDGRGDEVG